MSDKQKDTISTWAPIGLTIIMAIIGFAVTWGSLQAKQSAYEESSDRRITAIETSQQALLEKLSNLDVNVATLTANVSFIKERVK